MKKTKILSVFVVCFLSIFSGLHLITLESSAAKAKFEERSQKRDHLERARRILIGLEANEIDQAYEAVNKVQIFKDHFQEALEYDIPTFHPDGVEFKWPQPWKFAIACGTCITCAEIIPEARYDIKIRFDTTLVEEDSLKREEALQFMAKYNARKIDKFTFECPECGVDLLKQMNEELKSVPWKDSIMVFSIKCRYVIPNVILEMAKAEIPFDDMKVALEGKIKKPE